MPRQYHLAGTLLEDINPQKLASLYKILPLHLLEDINLQQLASLHQILPLHHHHFSILEITGLLLFLHATILKDKQQANNLTRLLSTQNSMVASQQIRISIQTKVASLNNKFLPPHSSTPEIIGPPRRII